MLAGMSSQRVIVVGGGAAGFFAAITCAEAAPDCEVTVLEKGAQFLSKVRISGGGRCNVTHACFDGRELAERFPRGEQALISAFHRFQAKDTVTWFESRGVKLKVETDGRMFPTTDSSQTIIDCLLRAATAAGVKLVANCGVTSVVRREEGGFEVGLAGGDSSHSTRSSKLQARSSRETPSTKFQPESQSPGSAGNLGLGPSPEAEGESLACDRLLLATGGCRTPALGQLAVSLGHTLAPPVPSLFTFHIEMPWLRELAGISVAEVEAAVPSAGLRERGALLVTHWGLSGPVILRLSAWGARELHKQDYRFPLRVNWLPRLSPDAIAAALQSRRKTQPARQVINAPLAPLPARLWEQLVNAAGIPRETRWAALSRTAQHKLLEQLIRTELPVTGKSLNKDEFVTCGGVPLSEVNFKTMESRICPGLHFAGELLDIDGITGGFNFQAAWTTGWIAGRAMASGRLS